MHWSIELAEYRRVVAEAYAAARAAGAGEAAWTAWRAARDRLIATHPASPLPEGRRGGGWTTPFFAHDPSWRTTAELVPAADPASFAIPHSGAGETRFTELGDLVFELRGGTHRLTAFWLDAYGGGIFLPFRDATCGDATYGGGRYLLDTVKGADLGGEGGRVVLDLNYAYHPSCAWDATWSCPLAPPQNRLDLAVEAGERLPLG